jgi:hypothetical protein
VCIGCTHGADWWGRVVTSLGLVRLNQLLGRRREQGDTLQSFDDFLQLVTVVPVYRWCNNQLREVDPKGLGVKGTRSGLFDREYLPLSWLAGRKIYTFQEHAFALINSQPADLAAGYATARIELAARHFARSC